MSARVFIHPRCLSGPAAGALYAGFEERGMNLGGLVIFPVPPKQVAHELVRHIAEADGRTTYERMDGVQFDHYSLPMDAA